MGKTINFEERRKKFVEQNREGIDIPNFMKNNGTNRNKEVYKGKKENRRRVQTKNKKNRKRILAKRLATIGLVGLIAFGGYNYYKDYQQENNSITLEQALENGETLESLKIDSSIEERIKDIKEKLSNPDLSNQELIKLSIEINELQFDTLKTKLAKTLNVDESDIKLYTGLVSKESGETYQSVKVKGGETYSKEDLITDFVNKENTIDLNTAGYIEGIGNLMKFIGKSQEGNIDSDGIMKICKETIKEIDTMAAAEMSIDSKGNISVEKINKKDLAKENEQTSKKENKQIEDDGIELE